MASEQEQVPIPEPLPRGFELSGGDYVIESELPPLQMGRAYKARDSRLSVVVAINVLSPDPSDDLRLQRFRHCVKKASLGGKSVYNYAEWRGIAYVVVPYVEGVGAAVDVAK